MPRPGQPPASTLRNRNRINNKSRLKIVHGNFDTDPIIPDEDEEKNRLLQSVAGVDQEDANEHHLQAVLSEAALRNHSAGRSTRGTDKEKSAPSAAFIPIPDHTGVADDYEKLYPQNRWKDPISYVQSSDTVEERCTAALANGFSYYMDERDAEWLEKNNEEARGEGTSTQGAVLTAGTRASSRSAKAKGKEPEGTQSVVISEDEFELVMGLYEKLTHEKTEFLHHSLATGMTFPTFSEYQDAFSSPLPLATFATYSAPKWLPPPSQLLRIARAIYPYWKERRLERGGHRIIPVLNFDEADTLNESYVCFRRRDVKAVRKTRASQVTSSDKLARLQTEFSFPLELAKHILVREQVKRDSARQSSIVWNQRVSLVDLKCQNSSLVDKMDEELLIDKERPSKKPEASRINGVRVPPKHDPGSQATPVRADAVRPKERYALIHTKIESYLSKQKELDQHWEDHVDFGYVSPMLPYSSRLFKYVNPSEAPSWPAQRSGSEDTASSDGAPVQKRPVRVRYGRGGRMLVDRRLPASSRGVPKKHRRRPTVMGSDAEDDSMDVDKEQEEDEEANRRLAERWRFDADDLPAYGPGGSDEHDRILVDDYDLKYLRHTVSLLSDVDVGHLLNDPTITRVMPDGRKENVIPFKLGMVPPVARMAPGAGRVFPAPGMQQQAQPQLLQQQQAIMISQAGQQNAAASQLQQSATATAGVPLTMPHTAVNGTPISVSQQLKMQPSSVNLTHMRISANGGIRAAAALPQAQLSGNPQQPSQPVTPVPPQSSPPPRPSSSLAHAQPAVNGIVINGVNRPAMSVPHTDAMKSVETAAPGSLFSVPNGVTSTTYLQSTDSHELQLQSHVQDTNGMHNGQGHYIARPKSQQGQQSPHLQQHQQAIHMSVPTTNGHSGQHLSPMGGYAALANANTSPTSYNANLLHPQSTNQAASALSQQQVQNLKSVFNAANATPSAYLPLSGNVNVNLNVGMNGAGNTNGGYNMHNMQSLQNMQMGNNMGSPMNMNLKLPPARQMQWSTPAVGAGTSPPHQRPGSVVNGVANGTPMSSSPSMRNSTVPAQHIPVRTPSANGSRAGTRGAMPNAQMMNGQMHQQLQQMSPHMQHASPMQQHHSPSPLPSISHPHSQSPPRLAQTSAMTMAGVNSPMMQHQQQQPVGNTQGGY